MTTLSISGTLMNNYASLTLIGDNFYDELYLGNQFRLKADASNTVTTNYLSTNYTNTVDLISVFYNKTETGNMLLSYSTGSYVGYNFYTKTDTGNLLTDKVSTTGDATINGNLDVGSVTIDAGSYTMGKFSVGDTTAYESFNGNVNGFNLKPQTHEFCCLCYKCRFNCESYWVMLFE